MFCTWESVIFYCSTTTSRDQIVCEVSIFLIVELWVILYCCCETGQMAVCVSDGFNIGHCFEREKTRTFCDCLCLHLGLSLWVERGEGELLRRAALCCWMCFYPYTLELIPDFAVGTVLTFWQHIFFFPPNFSTPCI